MIVLRLPNPSGYNYITVMKHTWSNTSVHDVICTYSSPSDSWSVGGFRRLGGGGDLERVALASAYTILVNVLIILLLT